MAIHYNSFAAHRHVTEKPFSHFEHPVSELLDRVRRNWDFRVPGYRDGVVLVSVDPGGFWTGLSTLQVSDELVGVYLPRKEGEAPRTRFGIRPRRVWVRIPPGTP